MEKTNHLPRVGVDLMGCDLAPKDLLTSLLASSIEEAEFFLFGPKELFTGVAPPKHFAFVEAKDVIRPDEDPLTAVRQKKNSSMVLGVSMLKEGKLDAMISAGNTGALMASGTLMLKTLPGIDRPALLALIPTKKDPVAVIDVGANLQVDAKNLLQFAQMGIAFQRARGIERPRIGLLNIGEEKKKGTAELQKAYKFLEESKTSAKFVGNIEGRDVFRGEIDVLITDGFTGNVFLKTAEGIAGFVLDEMRTLGPLTKVPGLKSLFGALKARLHFAEYPGALLCGIDGIVMKCHGASTPDAFVATIKSATRLVKHGFLKQLQDCL